MKFSIGKNPKALNEWFLIEDWREEQIKSELCCSIMPPKGYGQDEMVTLKFNALIRCIEIALNDVQPVQKINRELQMKQAELKEHIADLHVMRRRFLDACRGVDIQHNGFGPAFDAAQISKKSEPI